MAARRRPWPSRSTGTIGSGARGYAASHVAKVLQCRAFSALGLRKIILYDRPKRERKARDCAGVQPCCYRHPAEERSHAEAVKSIRLCRRRVPLQSLPLMAVPGRPEVPHAQTLDCARIREGTWEHDERHVERYGEGVHHGNALAH